MRRSSASPAYTGRVWRQEVRATLLLAYPLILTNLTQAGIQATDVIMLGWAGPRQLAAGALGANLFTIFLVFGMGLMTAASPMIAQELGARFNSIRDVRRTVRQAMWSAVVLVLPAWLALWHAEAIFGALGQDPGLSSAAAAYLRALQWGLLPALGFYVLRGFVSALERPIWSLVVSGAGILLNGALAYALIFGRWGMPQLELTGAGIASAVTNLLMFAAMTLVVTRHRSFRRFHLLGNFWRPDRARFVRLWRLGLPIAAIFALEFGVFSAAVFLMGLIDLASMAAHAIAIQIAALTFMVPLGLSQAVTVRVGLALGRGDKAGITRAGWTCFALGVGFMTVMALALIAFPYPLIHAFMDEADPANASVIPLAVTFLGVGALFQIVDGAQAVGAGMLRGLGDTAVPMIYAIFGYWVVAIGIGVALGFGAGWGGVGIWVGLASGLAVVSVLMIIRWMRREQLGLTSLPSTR